MPTKSIEDIALEITKLFGPAPILSTEREEIYFAIQWRFIACVKPGDILLYGLVRQITDATWEIKRYTRYKTIAIESRFRQALEHQAKVIKTNQERAREAMAKLKTPANELERVDELADVVNGSIPAVDDILKRQPEELDHVRALQANIEFHQQIDQCLEAAIARRDDALKQIDRYGKGLAARLRGVSDRIVESDDPDEPGEASLVPANGGRR